MKRLLLLLSLVLTGIGLSAQTISMTTSNGELSSDKKTWTSNAASGMAGVTISTTLGTAMEAVSTDAGSYYYLTPKTNTSSHVYTITAPSGYTVSGYSITFINARTGNNYYVYLRKGKNAPTNSTYDGRATKTSPATVTVTGNTTNSLQFSVKNGQSNASQRLQVTDFTITIEAPASADISWSASSAEVSTNDASHTYPTLANPHGLAVKYSSSNEEAATIDANTGEISLWGPGETTITATWVKQTVGGTEYPAGSESYDLTVTGSYVPTLVWSADNALVRSTDLSTMPLLNNPAGLLLSFSSSKEKVATIDDAGNINILSSGTTTITATAAPQTLGGKTYFGATASFELTTVKVSSEANADAMETSSLFPTLAEWDYSKVLDVFYNAIKAGRYYPTDAEWEAAGFKADDIAFMRSHVKKHQRIQSNGNDHSIADADYWNANRRFAYHSAVGTGKDGSATSLPSNSFASETFTMWNYVELFSPSNFPFGKVSGMWVDAAHKNGASITGGGAIFESPDAFASFDSKVRGKDSSEPSGYKYVRAMVSMLMYFGQDGFFLTNWAGSDDYGDDAQRDYMKALYDEAAARGFDNNLRVQIQYMTNYQSYNKYAEWGTKGDGRVTDLALDWMSASGYSSQHLSTNLPEAQANFKEQVGDEYANRLYGMFNYSGFAQPWQALKGNSAGLAFWGEREASRFMQFTTGDNAKQFMNNLFANQEGIFSGGNRNPNATPEVYVGEGRYSWNNFDEFCGFATFMPEQSSVVGKLPFATNFQVGGGQFYNYRGRKTGGEWYNISAQDVVPTYRWLVVNDASASTKVTNTSIVPRFSYDDSYIGGTMLKITGAGSTAGDVVLYKTQLNVSGANPIAKVAVKTPDAAGATNLQVKLQVDGAWKTYNVGSTNGTTWEEKTISLSDISAGAVIENIALRLTSVSTATNLYVGKLEINDDSHATPAAITDVNAKISNESAGSMTVKVWWNVDKELNQYGQLFNEDINVDHFEVLYKPYEDADVVEVARTSQWAAVVPGITMNAIDDPWIGVRAVSTDLKTYSDIVWIHIGHNQNFDSSEYGYGYGAPSVANGQFIDLIKNKFKFITANTNGAIQDLDYSIVNYGDPYVGTDSPKRPATELVAGGPALIDITSYEDASDLSIIASPGSEITFTFTHNDVGSGSFSYDFLCVFADWYRVGSFADDPIKTIGFSNRAQYPNGTIKADDNSDPNGDKPDLSAADNSIMEDYYVSGAGTSNCTRKFTFTIPADAAPGNSRLRLVFNDAWSPMPGATSAISKAIAYDFPIEVLDEGQVPGESPSVQGKDKGEASEPSGLPGAAVSTWGDLQDGGVYYLTTEDGNGNTNFLYNNGSGLSVSSGVAKEDRADFIDGADYSYKFVAHKTDGNNFVLTTGHGGYYNVQSITDDFGTTVAITDGATPSTANDPMLSFTGVVNDMLQVRAAKYPNEVVVRPTSCANFDGVTENIGIATWSAPYEAILPAGLQAYIIQGAFDKNEKSYASIVPVEVTQGGVNVVPANVGVLLVSTGVEVPESGLKFIMTPAASSGAVDPSAANYMLSFTTKDYDKGTNHLTAGGLYYILSSTDGTAATRKLYQLNTSKPANLIPNPNKAVLDANSFSLSAPGLRLVWDTTKTSVGKVVLNDDANAPAYDLQGRRINGNYKGIFIKNGKKIVKF